MDLTKQYNTPIPPERQKAFDSWLAKSGKAKDYYDYDVQGYWLSGAANDPRGHGSDEFKKPNHPTFSVDSKYSTPQLPGGIWTDKGFIAHPSNFIHQTPDDLKAYFKQVEPGSLLYLPPNAPGPIQAPQPQMHINPLGFLGKLF